MKSDVDELLRLNDLRSIASGIAKELRNRNLSAIRGFPLCLGGTSKLSLRCNDLLHAVNSELESYDIDQLQTTHSWLVFHAENTDGLIDRHLLARNISTQLVIECMPTLEDEFKSIDDFKLVRAHGLEVDKHGLVSLNNPRLELLHHAVGLDDDKLLYLHPFMRRSYRANFVDLPAYLRNELKAENEVKVRFDPERLGQRKYYQNLIEADYWHGPKLSEKVLYDKTLNARTVHASRGITSLSYDVRYTVFRTRMMDDNLREFIIEEYCPVKQTFGGEEYSPGFAENMCMQKFGHFVFDQELGIINHLDGAVRLMETKEYADLYADIALGKDVGDQLGRRKKMFLVEGAIPLDRSGELMAEWFRYNSLVIEYFTGEDIEPAITYEKLEASLAD